MALMHNFYCKKGVLIFLLCVLVQLYYIMICTLNSRIICYSYVSFFVEFGPTFSANHALFFNILYPTGPQIVPVPFISISNQSSTFSVSLTRFFSIKPTPDTFVSHAVSCSV